MRTTRLNRRLSTVFAVCVVLLGGVATSETTSAWTQPVTPVVHDGKLASGLDFSCAVEGNDVVKCWGANDSYQTGQATDGPVSSPSTVAVDSVERVAAGAAHACALKSNGSVWCWGSNSVGQSGPSGVGLSSATPQQVTLASAASSITAGGEHSCAVLVGNTVQCWGENSYGQLGDGTTTAATTAPVTVSGISATVVAAGSRHTCALRTDQTVWCWGANSDGQLGDATTTERHVPVQAQGLTGVSMIESGLYATCAVASGAASCWGANSDGELGSGSGSSASAPTPVSLSGVTTLSIGDTVACFVLVSGELYCSGTNREGQLGAPLESTTPSPVRVTSFFGEASVVQAATNHVCALSIAGELSCWGSNANGQIGIGSILHSYTPRPLWGADSPSSISVGPNNSCAVRSGDVFCWGDNMYGQLGVGSTTAQSDRGRATGVFSGTGSAPVSVVTNSRSTCASRVDGTLWCWGLNYHGQLGDNSSTNRSAPVAATVSDVGSFSLGDSHTCAVNTYSTTVSCWGAGGNGRLGNGSTASSTGAVSVVGVGGTGSLAGVSQVALGAAHSCALQAASTGMGKVFCWGYGSMGQMGNATTSNTNTAPVEVAGISDAIQISAGAYHTCALRVDGSVRCWGMNAYGQLGEGTTLQRSSPALMQIGGTALVVAAGGETTCVLLTSGVVECTGQNTYGTLGDGSVTSSAEPLETSLPVGYDVSALAVSSTHVCAIATADPIAVLCWGTNVQGVLGVDPDVSQTAARSVAAYASPVTTTTTTTTTTTAPVTTPPAMTTTTVAPGAEIPTPTVAQTTTTTPVPSLSVSCSTSAKAQLSCTAKRPSGASGTVKYRLSCSASSSSKAASVSSSRSRTTVSISRLKSKKTYSCTMKATKSSTVLAQTTFSKKIR